MAVSLEGIIEQQAIAALDNFGSTLDSLLKLHKETGNPNALLCYQRLVARYQQQTFSGAPASENNSQGVAGEARYFGAPASDNNMTQANLKSTTQRGRPKKSGQTIVKTFIYKANNQKETNQRLQMFYGALVQIGWISQDTNQQDFIDIFSGKESSVRVKWMNDVNSLSELFRQLIVRKKYVHLPTGVSIWVMVNAHFWDHQGNKEFGNERLRMTHTPKDKMDYIEWFVRLMDPYQDLEELRVEMMAQR